MDARNDSMSVEDRMTTKLIRRIGELVFEVSRLEAALEVVTRQLQAAQEGADGDELEDTVQS